MSRLMWKIPASANFLKYLDAVDFPEYMPGFEHRYLGKNLTAAHNRTLATQVDVSENDFIIMSFIYVEGRKFYYRFSDNSWFVAVDGK